MPKTNLMRYGIALGTNLGDRATHLRTAVEHLTQLGAEVLAIGQVYETSPVQCPEGSQPFLNTVLELESALAPLELHAQLQRIEREMGRPELRAQNSPRPIDLDVLYADGVVMNDPRLTLPHPRLHLRRFVLQPLADIQPQRVIPPHHQSVSELLRILPEMAAEQVQPYHGVFRI
jgi:2-amino-4-hydroxy-6-hydroxymethyldihydropteridine diphosphokinase